ncbi:hypothetical protein Tco_0068197, partial [Tanacetum coccineum]
TLDHSSSRHSTSGHSSYGHTPPVTTIVDSSTPSRFIYPPLPSTSRYSEAYRHWRSASLSTMYPLTTYESSAGDSSSESSAGPSRKRCRFRDSYSSGDSVEEDIEADAAAVEAAAAMNVEAGIDAEMIRVIELAVADDIAEPTNEGYPDLELYDHMHKIPVDRITNIEVGQRYLEADGLIASGERESWFA